MAGQSQVGGWVGDVQWVDVMWWLMVTIQWMGGQVAGADGGMGCYHNLETEGWLLVCC